ncbi:MAG: restriction endonuclease subunit S [Gammaproteobacteria bacterium]|nr:restriction endonuclease subunit S [Gammaproteobacteria bacterium]
MGNARTLDTLNLPPGYKQEDVGVIPADWDCSRLGDLTTRVGSGITPTGGKRVYVTDGRPFLRSQNVGWGFLDLRDIAFITDETHATFAASEIKEGDVLLNITGASIGRSAVADSSVALGNVNQHVCEIRPDPDQLDSYFLNSFLLSAAGQRQIDSFQAGGNRQGLNFIQIRSFLVPQPSLREQCDIAAALTDVGALLDSLDNLIAKKRSLKQAATQQLLTGLTRLPGFKAKWVVRPLCKVGDIKSGGTPSTAQAHFWDGGVPWCTPSDVTALHGGKYISETTRTISTAGVQFSSAEVLPPGSLIVTSRATIGECAINIVPVTTNQGFKNVVPFAEVHVEFLYYLMTIQKTGLLALCAGSTFLEIGKKQLSSYEVTLPIDREEQEAIATILSDMDAEIDALEARRNKTQDLKQAMMQELLTGKTRLVKPETANA